MEPRGRACCVSSRAGGGRILAGAVREGRQSAHVSMAGQEQGSRRATVRREERGTKGGARINTFSPNFVGPPDGRLVKFSNGVWDSEERTKGGITRRDTTCTMRNRK
jgi:hypothetical protein